VGRPPTRDRYREQRRHLALLIDTALREGQRGDGTPRANWEPWTDTSFANRLNVSASNVNDWRNRQDPVRPNNIVPLLNAFYGKLPEFAAARREMDRAWDRARGIDTEDPPDPGKVETRKFSDIAEVVYLLLNQPTPQNLGTLLVPYTLRLFCDQDQQIDIKVNGKPVRVKFEIGLTKPLFIVESQNWQPVQDTIFRRKKHRCTVPGPVPDSVLITGDRDGRGRIVGEPLEDEPHIIMESTGVDGDGQITMSVQVPRDGFSVALTDAGPVSATQSDVLDAIFAEAVPRDASGRRLVVAKAAVKLPVVKVPEA